MSVASVTRNLRASKRFRSTKGASKARRDQINAEIRAMRDLLPIGAEERERLSYLHSMSLICTFIRKTVLLMGVDEDRCAVSPLNESFLQALPGFIVALTSDGKLLYVSENVQEYIGLSMVDVLQGDSFYDMMDSGDAEALKLLLRDPLVSAERSLVCRMLSSKALRLRHGSCSMLVTGRFQSHSVFVALCTPTADILQDRQLLAASGCFLTLHQPDMSLRRAAHSVLFHLGFSAEELIGRSWYGLLHPDDIMRAAHGHTTLLGDEGEVSAQMLVRMQRKDLSWIRLYVFATIEAAKESISCRNHIISETEAVYLREKLYGGASPLSQGPVSPPETPGETRSKARRRWESGVSFTPPYSPASSLTSDLLPDGYGALEQLCGPSEAFAVSAAYHPYTDPLPAVRLPDAHLVPVSRPTLDTSDCVLHPEHFRFVQNGVSALLTPEPSPSADTHFLYGPETGTLAQQIRSLACSFDAYSSGVCRPEPLLDEAVIDSILRDLDAVKHTGCAWMVPPPEPLQHCLYAGIR